ncbi:hypothetical protein ABZ177_22710 [Streptomyces sp. NPDC006284]
MFSLSTPLALTIGPVAMWGWLVLVPVEVLLGRWANAPRRPHRLTHPPGE